MKTKILFGSAILILFLSCSKDDGAVPIAQNKPPLPFKLIAPGASAPNESRLPIFTWEKSADPEGHQISYGLFMGDGGEPTFPVAESLDNTMFISTDTLDFGQEYTWMVEARDPKGAITNSQAQSFTVQSPPVEFLRRHAIGMTDMYFEYSDDGYLDSLEDVTQDSWGLKYDTQGKLERIYMGMQTAFIYSYTIQGRQETVGKFSIGSSESWEFEYNSDRESLQRIKHLIQEIGGTNLDEEVTFVYEDKVSIVDTAAPKLSQIQIGNVTMNGTDSKRIILEWIEDNISKITIEKNSPTGFIFSVQLEFEYDNNVNPYYTIIKEQFGFDAFYVCNIETGLETINFGPFFWQSKNNVTKIKKTEQDNGIWYTTKTNYDYTYSKDYYPTSATVVNNYDDLSSLQWMEEWSY